MPDFHSVSDVEILDPFAGPIDWMRTYTVWIIVLVYLLQIEIHLVMKPLLMLPGVHVRRVHDYLECVAEVMRVDGDTTTIDSIQDTIPIEKAP